MKPQVALAFLILFSLVSLSGVYAETTYLEAGQCKNMSYQESSVDSGGNSIILNKTDIFCARDINITANISNLSNENLTLYDYEVPIFIEGDGEFIKVTIGTNTQSFPRNLGYFNYDAKQIFSCPAINKTIEGDPESLKTCLGILKDTKDLTVDEKADYKKCQTERDDFKVEWEKRGMEIDTKDTQLNDCASNLKISDDKKQGSGLSNVMLIIIVIILLVIVAVFVILRIRERSNSVGDLA
ncbi:MAG TPA: hypothetical protein VJH92_01150 [Candidatus Nanoarchaeia archaeon]|nr:hypothetical protein [Candidatus Nanoarchaeia archaeon]